MGKVANGDIVVAGYTSMLIQKNFAARALIVEINKI
jgi:hypothetical protein